MKMYWFNAKKKWRFKLVYKIEQEKINLIKSIMLIGRESDIYVWYLLKANVIQNWLNVGLHIYEDSCKKLPHPPCCWYKYQDVPINPTYYRIIERFCFPGIIFKSCQASDNWKQYSHKNTFCCFHFKILGYFSLSFLIGKWLCILFYHSPIHSLI